MEYTNSQIDCTGIVDEGVKTLCQAVNMNELRIEQLTETNQANNVLLVSALDAKLNSIGFYLHIIFIFAFVYIILKWLTNLIKNIALGW